MQYAKERLASQLSAAVFEFENQSFDKQIDFINDPAKLKALFCTRRASKSYTAGLYLVKEALETPGVSCLYLALTRYSAKGIMWKDILKAIDKKHKLGMKFNETSLTATLPNGSEICLLGVDSTEEEKQKLLGKKYKIAVIDEAASYTIDLKELVYSILKPALADHRGTICLMGTPGNFTKGLFFEVTNGQEPGWSLHQWTTFDNPFMAKQWQEEIDELIKNNPLIIETPWFKQMYLGQWVVDKNKLVYKYSAEKNNYLDLPILTRGKYYYSMGVDLGYDDDTAFSIGCYSDHDPNLYIVETFKKSKMDITDVAEKTKEFELKYNLDKIIVDGANKQAVEEIRKRHGIPLVTADKTGKADFIEIMNAELIQGNIKVNTKQAFDLIDEWLGLIWMTKGEEIIIPKKEHSGCPNHISDSTLYLWRYCYQYMWQKLEVKARPGSEEWFRQQQDEMLRNAQNEVLMKQNEEREEEMMYGTSEDDFGGF